MRQATIFTYDTSHRKALLRNRFYWRLYGCMRRSKFGKYVYEEKGILSGIPHLKPTESVIIVGNSHAPGIRNFLKSQKVRWSEHRIMLERGERDRLAAPMTGLRNA